MFIGAPAITLTAYFDLLLGLPHCQIPPLSLLAKSGYELVDFADELTGVEVSVMVFKHFYECVEIGEEGFGL